MDERETLLGIVELNEAKRLQAALAETGVAIRLQGNPQTCSTRGCRITVEVYADPQDLPRISEYLEQEKQKTYEGLDVDFEMHNEVFDTDKDQARCPACGTRFSTQSTECPDCGLVFVTDNQE
jgi:rubrerythrin